VPVGGSPECPERSGKVARQARINFSKEACVYCGSAEDVTADHVPPKNIFSKPRPNDLITVPACRLHNGGASLDDEYFRERLSLSEQAGELSAAQAGREASLRALKKPEAPGLRRTFLRDLRAVGVTAGRGILLGQRVAFEVDLNRIHSVVERTIRGLYWSVTRSRVPEDYQVVVHGNDSLMQERSELVAEIEQRIVAPLSQVPESLIGDGAFSYRYLIADEDHRSVIWALMFYSRVPFIGIVAPKKMFQQQP
jgi:hypothetical protein